MKDIQFSKNFRLSEFTTSDTATKLKIDNTPNEMQTECLSILAVRLLQPLREAHKEPFHINSGYRCLQLNKAVGGVETSQHTKGQASDIKVANPRALLATLLKSELEFDQAILYPSFLHLSYKSGYNRKQVLYAKGVKP